MDLLELKSGDVVATRYRVRELLGAGGMGAVWVAEHVELGKVVALKVMLPSVLTSPDMHSRFVNEARAAATIGHPNIVEVFDLGFHEDCAFIAMEKLEGEELERRINRTGPLPVGDAVRIAIDLADAIGTAHQHGIVHRDLKPANVFLATRGRQRDVVKVLDFGIAKLTQSNSDVHTKTGAVFGSPLYMAPEQLQDAKSVDARADVYALGGILYAMLSGHPPFNETTLPQLFYKIVSCAPASLRLARPEVPEWLDQLVLYALNKRPEDRPANGQVFADLLERQGTTGVVVRPPPPPAPPPEVRTPSSQGNSASALTPMYSTAPPSLPVRRNGAVLALALGVVALGAMAALGFALLRSGAVATPEGSAETAAAPPSASVSATDTAQPTQPASAAPSVEASVTPPPSAEVAAAPAPSAPAPKPAAPKAPATSPQKPRPAADGKPAPPPLVPR